MSNQREQPPQWQEQQDPQHSLYKQTQWAQPYELSNQIQYDEYQQNSYEKLSEHHPGISIFRIIRGIFYFIATLISAFGFFGIFESFGYNSLMRGLGLFFMFGLIIAGIVLFLRIRHRITKLHSTQFIWWIVGATGAMIMAWTLEFAFYQNFTEGLGSFIFWCIFMLYGLTLAAIASW